MTDSNVVGGNIDGYDTGRGVINRGFQFLDFVFQEIVVGLP